MSKYNTLDGVEEMRTIFAQIRQSLKINHKQTSHAKMFDMLVAIEGTKSLLDEAWKIGKLHNLSDEEMQHEFIKIVNDFGELKEDLQQFFLKQKH